MSAKDPTAATPPDDGGQRATSRARLVTPLVAAATVAAVTVGGTMLVPRPHHPDAPAVLHLSGAAAAAAADSSASPPAVVGALPDQPGRAHVYTFPSGPAPEDRVRSLARALGLSAAPQRQSDYWRVVAGDALLVVSDVPGWPWSFRQVGGTETLVTRVPVTPRTPAGPAVGCNVTRRLCATPLRPQQGRVTGDQIPERPDASGVAPGVGPGTAGDGSTAGPSATTVRPADPPPVGAVVPPGGTLPPVMDTRLALSEQAVRQRLRPVLAALDLADDPTTVQLVPGHGGLTVDPVVDGLVTAGLTTRLVVGPDLRLQDATGWLAEPVRGAEYPLASARDTLSRTPVPACLGDYARRQGAAVAGARLGLLACRDRNSGEQLLVPAWRYDVQNPAADVPPLTLVAVDPRYLDLAPTSARPTATVPTPSAAGSRIGRVDPDTAVTGGAASAVPAPNR